MIFLRTSFSFLCFFILSQCSFFYLFIFSKPYLFPWKHSNSFLLFQKVHYLCFKKLVLSECSFLLNSSLFLRTNDCSYWRFYQNDQLLFPWFNRIHSNQVSANVRTKDSNAIFRFRIQYRSIFSLLLSFSEVIFYRLFSSISLWTKNLPYFIILQFFLFECLLDYVLTIFLFFL